MRYSKARFRYSDTLKNVSVVRIKSNRLPNVTLFCLNQKKERTSEEEMLYQRGEVFLNNWAEYRRGLQTCKWIDGLRAVDVARLSPRHSSNTDFNSKIMCCRDWSMCVAALSTRCNMHQGQQRQVHVQMRTGLSRNQLQWWFVYIYSLRFYLSIYVLFGTAEAS